MISSDLRIDGFEPAEWRRLLGVLSRATATGAASPSARSPMTGAAIGTAAGAATGASPAASIDGSRSSPPVLFVLERGLVRAVLRPPRVGRELPFDDPARYVVRGSFPGALRSLREQAGAKLAAAIERDAADRIAAAFDARLSVGADLVEQELTILRACRAELGRGLHVDPDLFSPVPIPSYAALQQTLDLLLPDDRAAALFVFDGGRMHASAIVEKRGGDVTRLTCARAIAPHATLPGDFRDGRHRALLDAMAAASLRPHAALFATRDAMRAILGPQPGALAQAVATRQAVIDPAPPWLLALTGAGAALGVAQTAGRLFGRFVPQRVKDTARDAARTFSPFSPLGFDPIQLYTDLTSLL